jgi:anti-sigma B factor antagonist
MTFEVTRANSVVVVTPHDLRLDLHISDAFRDALIAQIDDGYRCIVVNMEHVESIDSSGISAFISVLRRLGRDGDIRVCGLAPRVKTVFEITRLHLVIPVAERRPAEAVREAPESAGKSSAA